MNVRWVIGVDEAGRGPLAGPVAVGVVQVPINFDWEQIPGVNDSKQLAPKQRAALFRRALQLRSEQALNWSVAMSSAQRIDAKGIVPAITEAQARAFSKLKLLPPECLVKLDGGLKAPASFSNQETIIKGDSTEKVIGLASILAKETRDRYMRRIAPQFAAYDFATHKGYGTKAHREAIAQYGLSPIHRRTFCKNIKLL